MSVDQTIDRKVALVAGQLEIGTFQQAIRALWQIRVPSGLVVTLGLDRSDPGPATFARHIVKSATAGENRGSRRHTPHT